MFKKYCIKENGKIKLSSIQPDYSGDLTKEEMKKEIKKNIKKIKILQEKLYAESKQSLLIVLQALDAGGKDGTIRKVFGKINPQGCRVTSFKVPSDEEKAHDFLWRIHKEVPKKGMIGIFNRSHYEEVLVVKVHDWIDDDECEKRYKQIKYFEKLLAENGATIVKFFLYISKDEQKKRFQERLDVKEKNWKFSKKDVEERKYYDKYIKQYENVLENTGTDYAPWYIIPANKNTFRNYMISTIVLDTLENMNPKYPAPEEGLENFIIE